MGLIWVGNRESEIQYVSDLFSYSVTLYGTGKNNNFSYYTNNSSDDSILNFYLKTIQRLLDECQLNKVCFYSNKLAYRIISVFPALRERIICINSEKIINWFNSKTFCRTWLSKDMPVVDFALLSGDEVTIDKFKALFKGKKEFTVQLDDSSGGNGTYLVDETSKEKLEDLSKGICLVSPFIQPSYSVNCHILLDKNNTVFFPLSVQIIEKTQGKLIYKGADFIAAKDIPDGIKINIYNQVGKISRKLQMLGYKGICGIDFLIHESEAFFLEINPRFQASTILLNRVLREKYDCSIIQLNMDAFCDSLSSTDYKDLEVPYSMISFYRYGEQQYYHHMLSALLVEKETINLICDGIDLEHSKQGQYLYRAVISRNITSITTDGTVFLLQNLQNPRNPPDSVQSLKIALITQGIILTDNAAELLSKKGKYKEATFHAIDLILDDHCIVNCPIKTVFCRLSPYSINGKGNHLALFYLGNYLCDCDVDTQEKLNKTITTAGIPVHRIGFRTTDRVRIKHSNICDFKTQGAGCQFCNSKIDFNKSFQMEDIYEVIDCYLRNVDFRHFLIGGPTNLSENEEDKIIRIISYIRSKCEKPIYVMCVPPSDIAFIDECCQLGVTEFAFNLEIFDRDRARQLMPGKGAIPLQQYEAAFAYATKHLGKEGAVRSMLVLGLENLQSFLEGIKYLCQRGVSPMITPFRPLAGTPMAYQIAPDILYLEEALQCAKDICQIYRIPLGPQCTLCQNNTLV